MPTVLPVLRTAKSSKDGRAPLWVRISDTSGARYVSLGVKLHPRDWHPDKGVVRRSHPHHAELNALVSQKVREAERAFLRARLEGKDPSLAEVKQSVGPEAERGRDFFAFAEHSVTEMERRGKADSARRYRHVLFHKLKPHTGAPLPFTRIDVALLRSWETALIQRGNAAGTVSTAFRAFRAVYNKAEAEGLTGQRPNPFARFKSAPVPRSKKAKLSDAEMRAIEAVDLREGSPAWHARNAFVFAFYCAGMRFKDVCLLKRGDLRNEGGGGWRLIYTTSKTHRSFALKVPEQAVAIARLYGLGQMEAESGDDVYLFPFLAGEDVSTPERLRRVKDSRNTAVNTQLKKVAKAAGVKKSVSFHIARHSFADLARVRGIDLHTISKALGHTSLAVTENYLKALDQHALDGAMDELFRNSK